MRWLVVLGGVIVGFAGTSLMLRRQGEQPAVGANLVIYAGGNRCIHIHHWVPCLLAAVLLGASAHMWKAAYQSGVHFVTAALVGAAVTDFVYYTDFMQFDTPCT